MFTPAKFIQGAPGPYGGKAGQNDKRDCDQQQRDLMGVKWNLYHFDAKQKKQKGI
jgi:hypothetical protein